ncbi:MAG: putative lipoic acid-binding regulatory protein [Gammaproteobacteria bacterium]|jgi:putative lipoic acid-binding regulatory protein
MNANSPSESAFDFLDFLDFPEAYPLKVIGKPTAQFETEIVELVRARCPQAEHIEVASKQSRGGKYISLTVTFTAYSRQQLEDIYRDLYESGLVVMTL